MPKNLKPYLAHILFLLLGIGLSCYGIFFEKDSSLFTKYPKFVDFFINIGAGLICTVFTVTGVQFWVNRDLRKKTEDLLKFFGESVKDKNIKLVLARRTLKEPIFQYPCAESSDYFKNVFPEKTPVPKDKINWVAYDDLLIVAYLGKVFGKFLPERHLDISLEELRDEDRENIIKNETTISLGLGFTVHTYKILEMSGLLGNDDEENKIFLGWHENTDFFIFNKAKYIYPATVDNFDHPLFDHALVVCARWKETKNYHFICAGRTASGTAAAGRFLAEKWDVMLQLYKENVLQKDLKITSLALLIKHPSGFDEVSKTDAIDKIKIVDQIFLKKT